MDMFRLFRSRRQGEMSSAHALTVLDSLLEFQKSGYLCDTIIVTDDGQLRAHSAVLAAVSPVLKAALNVQESCGQRTLRTIVLAGVDLTVVNIVVRFIYSGDVVIPADCVADSNRLAAIFAVAQQLQVEIPAASKGFVHLKDDGSKTADCDEVENTQKLKADAAILENVHSDHPYFSSFHAPTEDSCTQLDTATDHVDSDDIVPDDCTELLGDNLPREKERKAEKSATGVKKPRVRKRAVCNLCGRICSSKAVYAQHCLTAHGITVPLAEPDSIQRRLSRRVNATRHPSCWVCGRICSSFAGFREHFLQKHPAEDQSILSDEKLLRSRAFVNPKKRQNGLERGARRPRIRRHRRYVCDLCGKVYRNLSDLNEHRLAHDGVGREDLVGIGAKSYICETCGKIFSRPSALASHRRWHLRYPSGPITRHKCGQCARTFTTRKNLQRHERKHTAGSESWLVCEHCGRSFVYRSSLLDHMAREHSDKLAGQPDVLPFSCARCGQKFSRILLLRHHIADQHRPPAAPKERCLCTLCGRSFASKFTLKMHTRVHTGELPHRCAVCNRMFRTTALLRRHAVRHSGKYRYACKWCGKQYNWPSLLVAHERIHSGDKPFTCDLCGRSFAKRGSLKEHIQRVHAKDENGSIKCEFCDAVFRRQLDFRRHCRQFHPVGKSTTVRTSSRLKQSARR